MRILLAVSLALSLACATHAADQPAPAKQAVAFDGNVLELAWEGENPGEKVKEFIPAGQTLDTWTKLASIREYSDLDNPQALAGSLVQQLKKSYPQSPSAIIENPDTGEVIVDFVVWPQDASFVEFNVFKYQKGKNGGVVAQQYALRAYEDQEAFLKGLRPVRQRLVELMSKGLKPTAVGEQTIEVQTGDTSESN